VCGFAYLGPWAGTHQGSRAGNNKALCWSEFVGEHSINPRAILPRKEGVEFVSRNRVPDVPDVPPFFVSRTAEDCAAHVRSREAHPGAMWSSSPPSRRGGRDPAPGSPFAQPRRSHPGENTISRHSGGGAMHATRKLTPG
jgi:hypothetical protein